MDEGEYQEMEVVAVGPIEKYSRHERRPHGEYQHQSRDKENSDTYQ